VYAFCHLLGEIAHHFGTASPSDGGDWFEALAAVSELIASSGKFNFLLSDGEYLIAYGHDRLHYAEYSVRDTSAAAEMDLAMIATEPLTLEDSWHTFQPGELRVYLLGRLVGRVKTRPRAAGTRVLSVPAA
jgi:glutamine amidotransferase